MRGADFTVAENISFWKNLTLVAVFFAVTPITIGVSLFSLFSFRQTAITAKTITAQNLPSVQYSGVQVYASLPPPLPSVSDQVGATDARSEIVKQYLEAYNSPLVPYSDFIVQTSDKYQLDFRLIPAIAQQESNLCKVIPPGSYNCWGWGINSASNLSFDSYQDGIDTVAKGLKKEYLNKGLNTVPQIMSKYNPNSPGGAWAQGVQEFMDQME